jgi:kumamolisin
MNTTHIDLPGNERAAKQDARKIRPADPNQIVDITVVLKGLKELPEPDPRVAPMRIADIERDYGADPADVDLVTRVLSSAPYGLKVVDASPGTRTVELEGTVSQMNKAFEVDLGVYETARQGQFRGREGGVRIPKELGGVVKAVLGLDERQVARRRQDAQRAGVALDTASDAAQGPEDLELRYAFPPGTASGQKIGILEFGGGYWESDLQAYCEQVSRRSQPVVTVVPVGLQSLSLSEIKAMKDRQAQANAFDASIEVNMDVQVAAGFCPNAEILVYFAPFTQRGWVNVLKKAIHDPNGPKFISVSWGNAEDSGDLSPAAIDAIDTALKTAANAGVTVCVSSGDDGAGDAVNDGKAHCDFPASSRYTLAVGGTMFPGGEAEQGWWDTPGARTGTSAGGGSSGGGRSTVFPAATWQDVDVVSVRTGQAAGRCIPDVSALAGEPLYNLIFDGKPFPNGGTSASAPLWASLLARIASNLPAGRQVGFLTPVLYQASAAGPPLGAVACTDIVVGQNDDLDYNNTSANPPISFKPVGGYQAAKGYDAVTGWGVPNGSALLKALSGGPSVANSLFKSLRSDSAPPGPKASPQPRMTQDPVAAMVIDHDALNDLAVKQSALEASARRQAWTDIAFPAGTSPSVLGDSASPSLPAADVVLITYTADEANAMAAVLTPGFLAIPPRASRTPAWTSYTHQYASYVPDLLPGSSPALDSRNLGLYKLIKLGDKNVLCFKSSLHLARDGKSIPIMRLVKQIASETGANLIITTGTAGGIGAGVQLGDAAITTECRFDLVRMFASETFNGTTVKSTFQLTDASYLAVANTQLIPLNAGALATSPLPPDRTPMIASGDVVFGGEPNVFVTTDGFLYDDAQNTFGLQGDGCMVEMDDAVVGLAVQSIPGSPPQWLAIRNASDPQLPIGASTQEASDIYMKYGFYTSFSSVLACWACVLGS